MSKTHSKMDSSKKISQFIQWHRQFYRSCDVTCLPTLQLRFNREGIPSPNHNSFISSHGFPSPIKSLASIPVPRSSKATSSSKLPIHLLHLSPICQQCYQQSPPIRRARETCPRNRQSQTLGRDLHDWDYCLCGDNVWARHI